MPKAKGGTKGGTIGQKIFAAGAIAHSILLVALYVSDIDIGRLAAISTFVWGFGAQRTQPLEWRKRKPSKNDAETEQ